jgi:hypothetical protein
VCASVSIKAVLRLTGVLFVPWPLAGWCAKILYLDFTPNLHHLGDLKDLSTYKLPQIRQLPTVILSSSLVTFAAKTAATNTVDALCSLLSTLSLLFIFATATQRAPSTGNYRALRRQERANRSIGEQELSHSRCCTTQDGSPCEKGSGTFLMTSVMIISL